MPLDRIRAYEPRDLDELVRLHKLQGFDYSLPDPSEELFVVKLVATDETDKPVMAALLRLTAEAYLLHDPKAGTPQERWQELLELHEATRSAAKCAGLADINCWVPAEVPQGFCRRLEALGWRQDRWRNFTYKLR